jgi:uncharacterized protein YecE (DUF72 family)
MVRKGTVFIGTSGYNYPHWSNNVFYPAGLPPNTWLEYYSKFFTTVELNVTFYRLPQEGMCKSWHERSPRNFAFAVKGSRYITHIKRLRDADDSLMLLRSRIRRLKQKLHVILWQLPPRFNVEVERLARFIKRLNVLKTRHVFEFRDARWFRDDVYGILKDNNIALCNADWPLADIEIPVTADFIYVRRHGAARIVYGGCYARKQLQRDARLIKAWRAKGKDVYVYFNNDAHGYAVQNALDLRTLVEPSSRRFYE